MCLWCMWCACVCGVHVYVVCECMCMWCVSACVCGVHVYVVYMVCVSVLCDVRVCVMCVVHEREYSREQCV